MNEKPRQSKSQSYKFFHPVYGKKKKNQLNLLDQFCDSTIQIFKLKLSQLYFQILDNKRNSNPLLAFGFKFHYIKKIYKNHMNMTQKKMV